MTRPSCSARACAPCWPRLFGRHSDRRLIEALGSQPQNAFDYSKQKTAISGSTTWPTWAMAGIPLTPWLTGCRNPSSHCAPSGARALRPAQDACCSSVAMRSIPIPHGRPMSKARRSRTPRLSPAGRNVRMCSPFRATTTGTTASSRSRAPSAARSAALPLAARSRRAATSHCGCPTTGGCWAWICSSRRSR